MSNNRDLVSNNALSPTIAHEVHCRAIVLHDGRNAIDISQLGIAKCILRIFMQKTPVALKGVLRRSRNDDAFIARADAHSKQTMVQLYGNHRN